MFLGLLKNIIRQSPLLASSAIQAPSISLRPAVGRLWQCVEYDAIMINHEEAMEEVLYAAMEDKDLQDRIP